MAIDQFESLAEYGGQIVTVVFYRRILGFLYRGQVPVKDGSHRLVWIPKWKIINGPEGGPIL